MVLRMSKRFGLLFFSAAKSILPRKMLGSTPIQISRSGFDSQFSIREGEGRCRAWPFLLPVGFIGDKGDPNKLSRNVNDFPLFCLVFLHRLCSSHCRCKS